MTDHTIDFEREDRLGFPEFIFGEAKTTEQISEILVAFKKRGSNCLVTRLQPEKGAALVENFANCSYDPVARTLLCGENLKPRECGTVGVIAAGTSDMPVVAETAAVLEFLGIPVRTFVDKGVAGIHRLHAVMPDLASADVIICIAGFEGALPSVLSGLVRQPIIGVPTSVGYGVAKGGFTALNAMLSSCANGLTVVNIDNGFGAAIAAARILNQDWKTK